MNLIIILSVFICLASVTAQDSSDTNLTIDESSQTDISQITIDDNDYKTESVENSESSANEQNSLNDSHSVFEIKKVSNDKLGVNNNDNLLAYSHTYELEPYHSEVVNYLSNFPIVSQGVQGKASNYNFRIYTIPANPIVGKQFEVVIDFESDNFPKDGTVWIDKYKTTGGGRNFD